MVSQVPRLREILRNGIDPVPTRLESRFARRHTGKVVQCRHGILVAYGKALQLLVQRVHELGVILGILTRVRVDRGQPFGQRPYITAPNGFAQEPAVELFGASVTAQAVAVLTHEEVGRFGITHVVYHEPIDSGHNNAGQPSIHGFALEQLSVEDHGIGPVAAVVH